LQTLGAPFNSGSTEALGDLVITNDTVLEMPPDGIFNCKTFQIVSNAVLTFRRNPLNTPVYILATGDILIDGRIDVSGGQGSAANGGLGGPGGFNGGKPGSGDIPPGAGFGPGGGLGGTGFDSNRPDTAGSGTYKAVNGVGGSNRKGAPSGSSRCSSRWWAARAVVAPTGFREWVAAVAAVPSWSPPAPRSPLGRRRSLSPWAVRERSILTVAAAVRCGWSHRLFSAPSILQSKGMPMWAGWDVCGWTPLTPARPALPFLLRMP
jgi:hypothetical protein